MSKLKSFFKELPIGMIISNIQIFIIVPVFLSLTGIAHYTLRGWIIAIGVPFACFFLALVIAFCLYCHSKKGGEV